MPIYLELIKDDRFIEITKDYNSILIIACPGCPNESLAHLKSVPLTKDPTITKNQTETEHYAINQEVRRLSKMLQEQGLFVENEVLDDKYLCLLNENDCIRLRNIIPRCDAVLILGCPAAFEGMKRIIGESSHVLLGMRSVALFFYRYKNVPTVGIKYITEAQFYPLY